MMLFFADGLAGAEGELMILAMAVLIVPNLFVSWLWNLAFRAPCGAVLLSAALGCAACVAAIGLLWEQTVPPFAAAAIAACAVPPVVLPVLKRASASPTAPSASPCDTARESSSAADRRS